MWGFVIVAMVMMLMRLIVLPAVITMVVLVLVVVVVADNTLGSCLPFRRLCCIERSVLNNADVQAPVKLTGLLPLGIQVPLSGQRQPGLIGDKTK